ncbi:MAG: hypothetical protein K0S09_1661 [Sphingobacteriaceae bacterium]|jgi:hypothetical protein|nr:hypothetical protein [Sphingobacteriaceae bacterium]
MEHSYSNLGELQAGIAALSIKKFEQEEAIKNCFKGPKAIFNTVASLFKSKNDSKSFLSELMNQDMITGISRVILPAILNMFVFKKSNFITKAIVTFLSQKAAKNIDSNLFSNITDKIKDVVSKIKLPHKTSHQPQIRDYGIPPDSETY